MCCGLESCKCTRASRAGLMGVSMLTKLQKFLLVLLGSVCILGSVFALTWTWPSRLVDQLTDSKSAQLHALNRNEERWNSGQHKHYRYVLQVLCYCVSDYLRPVAIEVRDGVTTSIRRVDDGSPVTGDGYAEQATIPKLFAYVRGVLGQSAREVEVSYDAELGYPLKVTIPAVPRGSDDGRDVVISAVQLLE